MLIILSNIGATVTPWMLFFQQSATVDKGMTTKTSTVAGYDTALGRVVLAALAALGVILATSPLFHRISADNFEAAQFAQALEPIIGRFGASLFALGMVEAGIVAAITISTSSAYAFGEVAGPAAQPESPGAGRQVVLRGVRRVCGGGGRHCFDSGTAAGVRGAGGERGGGAGDAAGTGLPLSAGERQRNHGRVKSPRWANALATLVVLLLTAAGILYGLSVVVPHAFTWIGGR